MARNTLRDGQFRTMKPMISRKSKVIVMAERIDCDTPMVKLVVGTEAIWLTDVEAECVADRIKRALDILPTSK